MVRIADGARGTAGADKAGAEMDEVRFAEHDGPGAAGPFHGGGGGGCGHVGELGARRGGRQARHVDVVLDGDHRSRQGQALSRGGGPGRAGGYVRQHMAQ